MRNKDINTLPAKYGTELDRNLVQLLTETLKFFETTTKSNDHNNFVGFNKWM